MADVNRPSTSGLMLFPIFLGVVRPPSLPPGVAGPAEPDRYVLINPSTQGMDVLQGGDIDRVGDLLMEMVMSSSLAEGRKGPPPASKASIEALRTVEGLGEGECSICLGELEKAADEAAAAKEMPCGHTYHGECIEKWLGMHGSCPICRYKMPEEEEGKANRTGDDAGVEDGDHRRMDRFSVTITFGRRDGDGDNSVNDVNQRTSRQSQQ